MKDSQKTINGAPKIEIVNLRDCRNFGKEGDICVDRSTKWGNPFQMGVHGDRDTVCEKYNWWIRKQISRNQIDIGEIAHARRLGCWCYPRKCHSEILRELIEEYNEIKRRSQK